ncbi:unnamed protein product [Alopecurus aequalis]
MASISYFAVALVLVMTTLSTVEMSTAAARRLRSPLNKPRPYLQPVSPGGYRIYIVLLLIPADGDRMDDAAHRAWHESFLPSKLTRDGQPRLRFSYTCVVNGFSALLTDEEAKRVLEKPGVVAAIPNSFRYKQTTRRTHRRHPLDLNNVF